jgi:hypothetical protein
VKFTVGFGPREFAFSKDYRSEDYMTRYPWNRKVSRLAMISLWLLFTWGQISWTQELKAGPAREAGATAARNVEDWSSLALVNGELYPERPLLGERDDLPQFTRELIQVKWRKGDPIDLYVIRPKGVAKPPAILYLYSYPSETDRFRNDDYCARLTRDGFAAIGFVSALTGHRYQNRPMKQWFVSELAEALGSSVHDVQMILNYLSTRDDLDMDKIGMFGEGSGGSIAILAAAVDPRIKTIDLLDPWGDWPEWMAKSELIPDEERPNYLKPEFLKKAAVLDPVQWLPQLKSQRIRIQQVMDDSVTPKAAKERIEAAAPRTAQVVRYESTREFFGAVSGGRVFQWAKEQLRPAPLKQPAIQALQKPGVRPVDSGRD